MTFKKVLPLILIVAIAGIFFGPFGARISNAADICCNVIGADPPRVVKNPSWTVCPSGTEPVDCGTAPIVSQTSDSPSGNCNPFHWNFENCVLSAAASITYYAIWTPANLFLGLGGMAMDTSIGLTISSPIFRELAEEKDGAVAVGWGISRDIVNIFLIFILLYIAIATILQISGYGAKELLVTLIIIAFLVNFSMVITKMIIDASNVLAVGFYNAFPKTTENGQTTIAVSDAFKKAFDLERIIIQDKAVQESKDLKNLYLVQFLTYLLGAVIAAIAGFLFLVFAILFVIRMVVLLVLMTLSPLAFAAMVLPSTKKHASDWWSSLFNQSFFAPAALFMLYLSAKIATSMRSLFQKYLGFGEGGIANMLIDAQNNTNWTNIGKFILQFIIIAIILIASIIISKQMGAMGADSVMKGLKKAGRKAQGYAGRISGRAAGLGAEGLLTTEAPGLRTIRRIPLVGRGLARVSALREKQLEAKKKELRKSYGAYSTAGLETLKKSPLTTARRREVIEKILAQREAAKKPKNLLEQIKEGLKAELKEEMEAEKPTSPPPSKSA